MALLIGLGALLYIGLIAWASSEGTLAALGRLGMPTVVLGTIVSSSAYLFRFIRWELLLRWLQHRLAVGENLRIYLAGLALTMTPGKIGETVRTALLLPRGVRIPHSLAAFLADRLSDVVAVSLLGVVAGLVAGQRHPVLELLAGLVIGGSLLLRALIGSRYWNVLLKRSSGSSKLGRALTATSQPLEAWAGLWSVPRLVVCVLLALVAYGSQALVFYFYAATVGSPASATTCIAIFASSTLIGAASLVPGGLGAMEASMVYQLVDAGTARNEAVAAVVATRLSTLWTGVLLGSLMLLSFSRSSGQSRRAPLAQSDPDD